MFVAGGETVRLTGIETALMAYLAERPHQVVGRDVLLSEVWDASGDLVTRAVDQAMRRLRRKIHDDARTPRHLVTVYGRGYRFDPVAVSRDPVPNVVDAPVGESAETGNVGPHPTPFFGRADELRRLREAFAEGAVALALMGPGGIGKTRLARRFARTVQPEYPGGSWLVDLSDCEGRTASVARIASALGVRLTTNAGPDESLGQIGRALDARGGVFVVLDNAEDAPADVEWALASLRDAATGARWLITTRVKLDLGEGTTWTLDPLDADAAAALFSDRASALRRDFDVAGHRDGVRRVVRRLDHIPLAIELAAARARLLPPAELLLRLDEGLATLGRSRQGPARHATMRAAIAGSWEVLADEERLAARALATMRGSFDVRTAEELLHAVAEARGSALDSGLDLLDALLDASWLHPALDVGARGRLGMYAVVRDFAEEQGGSPDRDALLGLHASTVLGRTGERVVQARGPAEREALDDLTLDEPNLAVIEKRFAGTQPELALTALGHRLPLAWRSGRGSRVAAGLEALVDGDALGASHRASALAALGRTRLLQLDPRGALGVLEEALSRDALSVAERPRALEALARARAQTGDVSGARQALDEAEAAADEAGDQDARGAVRCFRGRLLGFLGDLAGSDAELEAAAADFERAGRRSGVGEALGYLGTMQASTLRGQAALPRLERASRLLGEVGERRLRLVFDNVRAVLLQDRRRFDEARALLDGTCRDAAAQGALDPLVVAYAHRTMLALEQGRYADAEADLEAASEAFAGVDGHYFTSTFTWLAAQLARARGRLPEAVEHTARYLAELRAVGGEAGGGAALGMLGAIAADAGRVQEAEAALEGARARLEAVQDLRRLAAWPIRRAHLDLALARRGDEEASAHRARSRERLREARNTIVVGDAPALESSAVARLALRDLESSVRSDGSLKLRPSGAVADRVCGLIREMSQGE